jgi:thiol-disulfide isomerase/thioredoxin
VIADENGGIVEENGANIDQGEDKHDDAFSTENGLFVFTQVADIPAALPLELGDPVLLLLAVYSPTCPHCPFLLSNLETAAHFISQLSLENSPPLFAKLDGTLVDAVSLEEQLGVVSYPSLVFVRGGGGGDHNDDATVIDYIGLQDTWEDIYETVLHYWYRYAQRPTTVISLENVTELDSWVQTHGPLAVRHTLPALNPNLLSEEERTHIQWLMEEEEEENDEQEAHQEPFVFFVKCNDKSKENDDDRYLELSETMAARRNVLFFALHNCTGLFPTTLDTTTDNNNMLYYLSMSVSSPVKNWKNWKNDLEIKWLLPAKSALEPFVVQMTTPSVLWFDRKTVAPIAFPTFRKIHAVLFVDTHSNDGRFQKVAIQQFRQTCRLQQQRQQQSKNDDMVCLIVPQTERRILNTFGVDLWTPLDVQATQVEGAAAATGPIQPVLPTLLITDQRYGGTRRFYLDATTILSSTLAMKDFFHKFWNKELTPAMKSSSNRGGAPSPRTNKSGVHILTAASFHEDILMQTTEKHFLIYFFAPTCGHCKRFSILWNELAQLVRHLKWDTVLDITKMDVTTNEIIFFTKEFHLDIEQVPAVYYFGANSKMQPIRFDIADEFGDTAGRLSDPMDIVEWLLDVSDFDDAQLLRLILQDQNDEQETVSNQPKDDL